MSREKERLQEFTIPCLGRPFEHGMLYDCRTDQFIPNVTLWTQEKLKQGALDSKEKISSNFQVISDNSIKVKFSKFEVGANQKLSCLGGLVNVSGAAAYLTDQESSKSQVRISLKYQSTAWVEKVVIEKLGDLDNPDVFKDTPATHFVSGMQYGASAIFIFDQEISPNEDIHNFREFMKAMVEKLPAFSMSGNPVLDISDTDKTKVQKFRCKLYSDLPLPENPTTFEGAVKLCKDLPKLLNARDFPQKVLLCPLSRLNSEVAPISKEISTGLVNQTQEFMEELHELEMRSNDLLNSKVCTNFSAIKEQLSCFKERIAEYKVDFAKNLAILVPQIRSGKEEEVKLAELFTAKHATPFSDKRLSSWVDGKSAEIRVLEMYLDSLQGIEFAFAPGELSSVIGSPKYDHVISFTLNVVGRHDPYLDEMTTYLRTPKLSQEVINPDPTPWYSNNEVLRYLKFQTKQFIAFAEANQHMKQIKFAVTSSSSPEQSDKAAVIELHDEYAPEIFEPPSQPGTPHATSVTHNSIQVSWSKPKYGAQNVKFYTVFYCDHSSPPEQWKTARKKSTEESMTVKDLDSGKKYYFKVHAESKAGFNVSEISAPIETSLLSVPPGKPTASGVSHDSIQLQWSKAQCGEHNIDFYAISYHEITDLPDTESQWKIWKPTSTKPLATVSGLDPHTSYSFKIQAEFKTGISLVSDSSDPIETNPAPVPPGKPTASHKTHNSIQLRWSKPQHNVKFYTIFCYEVKDAVLKEFKQIKPTDSTASITVSGLSAQTVYCFKVCAEFKAGVDCVSDISDPIQTYPPPILPGKPTASNVTHNSVQLEWSKPEYAEQFVECYTVFYRKTEDPPVSQHQWKEYGPIDKESVTVDDLVAQTEYCFKVQAKFKASMDLISDVSDPIQTHPLPLSPGKPTASRVTHNSVQLKWSKPQCGAQNVEYYNILYREINDSPGLEDWKNMNLYITTESKHTVEHLTPQTLYSFKVQAIFKSTTVCSDISDSVQTYPSPVPPGKPIVSIITHNSVQLEWSKPQYQAQNVELYTISYHKINDLTEQWDETTSDEELIVVGSLIAQTEYYFKVQAKFEDGTSLDSDIIGPIQTDPPPKPPGKPVASNVTHNSVQLEWSKPQYSTQSVEFYTLLCCELNNTPSLECWKEERVDSTKESITVGNLAPQTMYSFKVYAQFKAGKLYSGVSDPVQTRPHPIPPGKPIACNITHNSIQLKWSKPQYQREAKNIKFYTVSYRKINDLTEQWDETQSNKELIIVGRLTPQTEYSFKIHAKFEDGMSLDSDISDPIQTYAPPTPPGKPMAYNVTHNTVQLEWSKPQYAGEQNIEFYTVFYHEIKDPPEPWQELIANGESATVNNLAAQKIYSFKVQAKHKTSLPVISVSEISDPIQTHPLPVPPGKPFATSVTHDVIHLEWSKAQCGAQKQNVEFYTVSCRQSNNTTAKWDEINTEDPITSETLSVCELDPQTDYSFQVCGIYKDGINGDVVLTSETSDPIQTKPYPIPPGKPTAFDVTHKILRLKWTKAEYGVENVEFYTVLYCEAKKPTGRWDELSKVSEESVSIKMPSHNKYCFKVDAVFKSGIHISSDVSDPIQTKPPPTPPGKPFGSNVTHDSIQLKWSKAHYGSQNAKCYTLFSRGINDPTRKWVEVKGEQAFFLESVTIRKLTPQTAYSFKVCAIFEAGLPNLSSEISDTIVTKPFPVHPGKPTPSEVTHNSIQLQWSSAQYGAEIAGLYTILYGEITEGYQTTLRSWIERTTNTSITIRNLTTEMKYFFQVKAECTDGIYLHSEFSDPIQTKPFPIPPGKLTASDVTHNSIQLEWSEAFYGKHKCEFYNVYLYETKNQQNWREFKTHTTSLPINRLTAETEYFFKVRAIFEAGGFLVSDPSTSIQTTPLPKPPGKPIAKKKTDKSIQLQWSKAQCGKEVIESYKVLYHTINDSQDVEQWKESTTSNTSVTISGLAAGTEYYFKIDAIMKARILHGKISDPIQTYSSPVPPGKPNVTNIAHNRVNLAWSKPHYDGHTFEYYTVLYCEIRNPKQEWKELHLTGILREESLSICQLSPQTGYYFKIRAKFEYDTSLYSDISDSVHTLPAQVIPGKPFPYSVTHNSIHLQWKRPYYGAQGIQFYTVLYREVAGPPDVWTEKKTKGAVESCTIYSLGSRKAYYFIVRVEMQPCDGLLSGTSDISDPIKTKDRIALQMLTKNPNKEGPLDIHKLAMTVEMQDKTRMIRKCCIKPRSGITSSVVATKEKVLMVVGATGAGKSTMINGMINYMLGAEWKDDFRFELIADEGPQSQTKSQTKWITAYTLPKMEGSPVPYTLTIIDTPGFGDTDGLERDKVITKQIKDFFSLKRPHGIDHINGIGFVTQSALARLTPTQKYIFGSILSIFGKDVADNIFMMVTFADGKSPPVMDAIKEAKIPFSSFYKFNNSALFASNQIDQEDEEDPEADNFDRMFWKMGTVSFKQFFSDFYKAKSTSLQLTKEVLDERDRLETTIGGLHPQIRIGLAAIEEMRQEEDVLKKHLTDIEQNKEFTFEIEITKQRKVNLAGKGIFVTNCLKCNFTCHDNCAIAKDEDKHGCWAMDSTGHCRICTEKCKWDQHVNRPFKFEEYVVKETRTSEDLKKKYDQAVDGKTEHESMMLGIDKQLETVHKKVLTMIKQIQKCLHRLDQIALKPNPLTELEFLELLIESEKQQAEPGWLHRVKYYEAAKEQAAILKTFGAEGLTEAQMDTNSVETKPVGRVASWYARFRYWLGLDQKE